MTTKSITGQRSPGGLSADRKEALLRLLSDQLIWVVLIVFFLVVALIDPRFLSRVNILNVLLHSTVLSILVIGESLCLIHGNFDLSVESTLGFAAVLGAILVLDQGVDPYLAIILMLAAGAFIGLLNALMILRLNIDPFVVTLGMLIVVRGLALVISEGITKYDFPEAFRIFAAHTKDGWISVPVIIMIVSYIVFHLVLSRSVFGRQIYAVGGNKEAAYVAGTNVNSVVLKAFVLSGLLSALAGLILSARLNSAPTTLGEGMVFEVTAAAVVGGVSLQGGRGNLIGALGGVLLISAIDSALTLTRVSAFWVDTSKGLILLAAVLLDTLKHRFIPILREMWLGDVLIDAGAPSEDAQP
jgi:ribose/xylose/arabinose/galactoside ABC-type transport system permease subunit